MRIRQADAGDLSGICSLADEIAAQHNGRAPHIFAPAPGAQRDRAFWAACIDQIDGAMFVAVASNGMVGFVTAKLSDTNAVSFLTPRRICRIGTIVVAQTHKRLGVGKNLLHHVEAWATTNAADEVRLEVFEFNVEAISFYEAQAFETQSRIMTKTLRK